MRFRQTIFWLGAFLLECLAYFLMFQKNFLLVGFFVHLLASAFLIFLGRVQFFFTLFLPFWGIMGSFILYLFCDTKGSTKLHEEVDDDWPRVSSGTSVAISKRGRDERILEELDLMPLVDCLAHSDLDLKRGAIEKLARLKTTEAIEVLLQNRSNPSMEVRFYVTSALTRLRKEFDEELEATRKQMKKDAYKISARIFLAKTYLKFAHSGLLDPATAEIYEEEALYHLNFSVQSEFASSDAFLQLFEIYKTRKNWGRAIAVLEMMEKQNKKTPEEISKLRAEIYFDMGDFLKMQHEFSNPPTKDPLFESLKQWWGGSSCLT